MRNVERGSLQAACVCVHALHNGLCLFSCMFVKKGKFVPAAGSRTSQQKSHLYLDARRSGSSCCEATKSWFFFFLQMLRSRDVPKRTECFAQSSERPPFTNKWVEVSHIDLNMRHLNPVEASELSLQAAKIKFDRRVSSWWLFGRPDPAHTSLHPNLNHPFPRPRQLAAVTCKRIELGLEGGLGCWSDGEKDTGGGGAQTGWGWWHQFWKMCVSMCLCACVCTCYILSSKICLILAKWGIF